MEKYNSYALIELGLWIRHLRNAKNLNMKSIKEGSKTLIENLDKFRFSVSKVGAQHLTIFVAENSDADEQEIINDFLAQKLTNIMSTLESIIFAEAHTKFHYITSERRYNLTYLLDKPDKLFASNVFNELPELCKYDFEECFKCIAYEVPTGAAFHMLRATEGFLKELYFSFIKQKRVKTPMWGNMVSQLEKKTRNKPPKELLEALDNIRKSYRNPTNHPEATYTISQAEDLMGLSIDVINKIHLAIRNNA
jgi:hypothetical protein